LTVATQIDDADGLPVVVRLGLEYLVVKGFFIRGGISARPFRHSAGLGYQRENWSLDFCNDPSRIIGVFAICLIYI
jgi:hypothetical protein